MKQDILDSKVLSRVGDVITQKPIKVTVSCKPKNRFIRFLMSIRIMSNKHVFELSPIVVGNMYRIASKIVEIPSDLLEKDVLHVLMNGAYKHIDKMVYAVACGLQNNHKEPSDGLIKLIKNEFTATDLVVVFDHILVQLNAKDFIKSIVLMKGLNVLNVQDQDAPNVETQE